MTKDTPLDRFFRDLGVSSEVLEQSETPSGTQKSNHFTILETPRMSHKRQYLIKKPCVYCKNEFRPRKDTYGKSNRGKYCSRKCCNVGRRLPLNATIEDVCQLYLSGTTLKEIADKLHTSLKTVHKTLREANVKMRRNGVRSKGLSQYKTSYGKFVHILVATEKFGRSPKKGEVVHHINLDKQDNTPDNLQILSSKSVHAQVHNSLDGLSSTLIKHGCIEFRDGKYAMSKCFENLLEWWTKTKRPRSQSDGGKNQSKPLATESLGSVSKP